jgi:hypothetical protein
MTLNPISIGKYHLFFGQPLQMKFKYPVVPRRLLSWLWLCKDAHLEETSIRPQHALGSLCKFNGRYYRYGKSKEKK